MANELILIVDADAKSRGVLDVSLKKAGYRVQTFERGHDALAWLDGGSAPSLVICEAASAGGMTGLALCSKVREDVAREELPFMILTDGAPSTELRRRAGELGVEDFLSRPIYSKEIAPRVQLLLQRREKESLALLDGAEVQGELGEVGLLDLVQALEERRRSAVIELTHGPRRGSLTCVGGQVVEASVGRLRGGAAVQRLLLWTQGSYKVRPAEGGKGRASGPDLLVEGLRERERWEAASAGQDLTRIFEVHYQKLADHLRDLPEEVHAVLRLFDGYRTLDDVVDDSPLAPTESLQAIQRLREQGLVRDITPAAERAAASLELGSPAKETEGEWLSMEAGETVGGRAGRRAEVKESEAETVRRRREERKRRKSQQLHAERTESVARLGSSAEAPSSRRIQAKGGAVEAQAEQMRRELEESLARKAAPVAAPVVAAGSLGLRAKLEAAEQESARLEAERQKLRAELEREEQAVRLEAERLRLEAERLEAERALSLVRAREEREARERAESERAELERLEAERRRVELELKARAESEARLKVEQEKLAAARKALEEAEAKLRQEQARSEAERAPALVVAAPLVVEPPKAEPPKEEVKAAVLPPLEAPKASAEGGSGAGVKTVKVEAVGPEPKAVKADDDEGFFDSHAHEDHAHDPEPAVSSSKLTVGVIAVLLAIGVGAVIYYAKTQEPEKPKPPVEAMKADAGAPAPSKDVGLADAVAAKDAEPAKDVAPDAAVVTPEQVVDARGKAREVMFELAFSRMFHPDTGLPLVADKDAPPVVEDPNAKPPVDGAKPPVDGAKVDGAKPPVDGAKAGGGDKVAPVVDRGPKEVKEPPISTAPDPVKFDDKGAKQEFDRRFKAGAALAKSGKCDKAIPELQAADSVQGGSSQVNSLLGRCFMSTGGFAKAVTYLEKAVRLNGTNADAVRMLGDAYQATGQRGKAIDAYRKYLELRPTGAVSDEIRRILAQYH